MTDRSILLNMSLDSIIQKKAKKRAARARARFVFQPGRPFWRQIATRTYMGLLKKSGKKRK